MLRPRLSIRPLAASLLALSLALVLQPSSRIFAQKPIVKPGKGPAYVVPPKNDPNYELMGEFVGQLRGARTRGSRRGKKGQSIALQVRPIAGNQFQAIAYYGGLPGESGHKSEEMQLIGLRSGENVVLSGGPWAIFVDPQGCNLVASSGKLLGRLKRVQRISPTLGAKPPQGATVLFDGSNVDQFAKADMTKEGLLQQGALIAPMFQDFNLHVEFRLPYMPKADGQQRGNSGLYLMSRYECQVLDSFGTKRVYDGLGALYKTKAPDVNMAFPPLRWQTYDVMFTAPRWASDGTKVRNAHITSWINGVKVQDNVSLANKTGAGKKEEPLLLPIHLQDHGDPVRFKNIWIVDRGITHSEFPVIATKSQRQEAAKLEWEQQPEPPKKPAEPPAKEETVKAEANETPVEKQTAGKDSSGKDTSGKNAADKGKENAEPKTAESAPKDNTATSNTDGENKPQSE